MTRPTRAELLQIGLEHLFNSAPVGICIIDQEFRYVRINENLAAMNGVSPDDHVGRTVRDILPQIADFVEPIYREVFVSGQERLDVEIKGEAPATRSDPGTYLVSFFPLKDKSERVVGITTVVSDVSMLKQAELQLMYSEQRLRQLIESTAAIPWEAEGDNRTFTFVGRRAEELLGFPADAWLEEGFWQAHIHPAERYALSKQLKQNCRDGANFAMEYRMVHASGEDVWVSDLCQATLKDGKTVSLRGFMIDITNLKLQSEALEQKNIALREMLGQLELEKAQLRENMTANAHEFLLPLLRQIKERLPDGDQVLVDMLESNLREATHPTARHLKDPDLGLTPREIEVCNMIREGLSTKEIAGVLNASARTVSNHRQNIRRKLDIANKDVNLTSYLKNI